MSGRKVTAALTAALAVMGAGFGAPAVGETPADTGEFLSPFAELSQFDSAPPKNGDEAKLIPPAVSMAMLPDGRVLYWGGVTASEDIVNNATMDIGAVSRPSPSRVMDVRPRVLDAGARPVWSVPTPETIGPLDHDSFCADLRVGPDGKVIVVGGTIWKDEPELPAEVKSVLQEYVGPGTSTELYGSYATRIFEPETNTWVSTDAMDMTAPGRWYPTLLTLGDGKMFLASGVYRLIKNTDGLNVHDTETWDPATRTWTNNGESGKSSLPLFARLHLLPDGRVFYGGAGQMWSPFGEALDEAVWNFHKAYDPATNAWTDLMGTSAYGAARSGAFSALLPLKAPYDKAEILVGGGTLGVSPGTLVANDLAEIITVQNGGTTSSSQRLDARLNNRRWFSTPVALPDGDLVIVNGGDKDEVIQPGAEQSVRQAELFDHETKTFKPLATAARDRTYHNTAILLPDASVLVGGHSPLPNGYGKHDNATHDLGLTANNFKDPSFEILKPPYLLKGPRPEILAAPGEIAYGDQINVAVGGDVSKLVLVRLPSTTHSTDADQRVVELPTQVLGALATATSPPSGNVAPPGYYYLFALDADGVPSVAKFVHVGGAVTGGVAGSW